MHESLIGLLEKAELAVADSADLVEPDALESVAQVIRDTRVRLSYPEDMVVAALAGGTGSGKSSLLNAIAEDDVVAVGGVRPTTSSPHAVVHPSRELQISGFLDHLELARSSANSVPRWLCLVDLPDNDSVEIDHRLLVEALIPRLDVVVWVTDPEKYRDAVLHNQHLQPLADYSDQFVFVLNQADRLTEDGRAQVVEDFTGALVDDGMTAPRVVVTSAHPPAGPPQGLDQLLDALRSVGDVDRQTTKRLLDLERAAKGLADAVGGSGVDFEHRAERINAVAADSIVKDENEVGVAELTRFFATLAAEIGGPASHIIESLAVSIPAVVQQLSDDHRESPSRGKRWIRRRDAVGRAVDGELHTALKSGIDNQLFAPIRSVLAERARANASIADLVVSVASARASAR